MNLKIIKSGLLLGAAASAVSMASPAVAQNTDEGFADDAIIVTARRVEENLQDVPISITVFNQEELTKRNIAVATDLATYTPSLSVNQRYGPEKSSFALRGFNQDQNTAPTVGVYFADVVGVRAQGGTTSGNTVGAGAFTDLENVQVLKGPQGTLFGRNTTGGAVLLVPKKPTGNLEGYIEGSIGDYDMRRVQGALNIPLSDTFKVRISADRHKRDGYMKNQLDDGVSPKAFNDLDYFYGRLSILAELTPTLENYTIVHYSDSNTNGYAARLTFCDRNPIDFTDPTGLKNPFDTGGPGGTSRYNQNRAAYAYAACDQIDRQAARGDGKRDVEVRNPGGYLDITQWQIINTTTWEASDTLTLKNIMSYGEFRERTKFDLNSTNFFVPDEPVIPFNHPVFGNILVSFPTAGDPVDQILLDTKPGDYNSAQWTFTEELQAQFESGDGRFSGVVGGYLEFSRPIGWQSGRTSIFGYCTPPAELACIAPMGVSVISQSRVKINFDNHGIFGQGTYRLTDKLSLTAGIRYTFDKIYGRSISTRYVFLDPAAFGPLAPLLPNPVLFQQACNDGVRHPGVDISDPVLVDIGLPSGPIQVAGGDGSHDEFQCFTPLTEKSSKPTWVINLDYKLNDDLMVYAKWARGYRQGGMTFTNPGLEIWGPESLDNYEVGLKSSFRGAVSGYFNLAAFYNDFTDQQVILQSIAKPGSGLAGGNVIGNAGKVEIYGLEVDASARLFEGLQLGLGYTYLHSEVKAFDVPVITDPNSPFAELRPTTSVGLPVTQAPKHTLAANVTYTLPLDESIGEVSIGATYTHRSANFFDFNSPIGRVPSTDLLNLNFDWKGVAGSPIDLAAFMTNVTNETYAVGVGLGDASFGFENLLYNPPRMYGVRVKFNFGQ